MIKLGKLISHGFQTAATFGAISLHCAQLSPDLRIFVLCEGRTEAQRRLCVAPLLKPRLALQAARRQDVLIAIFCSWPKVIHGKAGSK
jgi:hypothetical protein